MPVPDVVDVDVDVDDDDDDDDDVKGDEILVVDVIFVLTVDVDDENVDGCEELELTAVVED